MKIRKTSVIFALAIGLISCGGNTEKKESTKENQQVEHVETKETNYIVSTEKSEIQWKGTMMGMYSHEGTLKLKSGNFTAKGNNITGGEFVVDMTTINPTDENYSEEHPRENLIGHLSSSDFFAVDSFPTASFKITSVENNKLIGDLSIKGVTKPATITDVTVEKSNGEIKASGNLVFNRQDFGASYKAANDMVLSDDIELKITLSAKAK